MTPALQPVAPRTADAYALADVDQAVVDSLYHDVLHGWEASRFFALLSSTELCGLHSESEADYQLLTFLALGTRDPGQIERIARTSDRYRDKWDTRRGPQHSYLTRSIQQALAGTDREYRKRHRPLPPERDGVAPSVLRGYSDRDILMLPDPEWLIDGLIPGGGLVEVVGRYGSGKTFLLIDWLMHVAGGMAWQGRDVKAGPTLYLYGEGAMKPRVTAWRAVHGVEASTTVGVTYVPGTVNLLDGGAVTGLLAQIERGELGPPPVAIAFDTLSRMAPGDENSPEHGADVVAACDHIQRATGAVVILGHHTPWDPTAQRPKGSSKIPDCADAIYLLENTDGALKLICQKMRDAEAPAPIHLKLSAVPPALVVDAGQAPPTAVDALSTLLQAEGPLTKAELQLRLGKSARTIDRLIQEAGSRVVVVAGTGRRGCPAKYHATANPQVGGLAAEKATGAMARHGGVDVGTAEELPF